MTPLQALGWTARAFAPFTLDAEGHITAGRCRDCGAVVGVEDFAGHECAPSEHPEGTGACPLPSDGPCCGECARAYGEGDGAESGEGVGP